MHSLNILRYCAVKQLGSSQTSSIKLLHLSAVRDFGGYWREKKGLSKYGNEYGPLTDLPDWSYADGRPAPLGKGQRERKVKNANLTKRIIQLMSEVDFATEREKQMKAQAQEDRQKILREKLKAKGDLLEHKSKESIS